MSKLQQIILLGIYLMILQAYDAGITNAILLIGGSELNPIVSFLMGKFGVIPALVIVKLMAVIIIAVNVAYSIHISANRTKTTDSRIKLIRNALIVVSIIYTVAMVYSTVIYGMHFA